MPPLFDALTKDFVTGETFFVDLDDAWTDSGGALLSMLMNMLNCPHQFLLLNKLVTDESITATCSTVIFAHRSSKYVLLSYNRSDAEQHLYFSYSWYGYICTHEFVFSISIASSCFVTHGDRHIMFLGDAVQKIAKLPLIFYIFRALFLRFIHSDPTFLVLPNRTAYSHEELGQESVDSVSR